MLSRAKNVAAKVLKNEIIKTAHVLRQGIMICMLHIKF